MNVERNIILDTKVLTVFETENPQELVFHYKDVATAFGGIKRAALKDKGIYTCRISAIVYRKLNEAGIPTHFIREVSERELLCAKTENIPLRVIVRNRLAGSTAELLGVEDGTTIPNTIFELRYISGGPHAPMINSHHAVALGIVSYEEMDMIFSLAAKTNEVLKGMYAKAGIELVDFKMECGRASDGSIIISDEISPDNCRLWDINTGERLDKDRFRHDLSDVCASYKEVMDRLLNTEEK